MRRYKHQIVQFDAGTKNTVSSTLVRTLLAKGQSIKYLVPEGCYRYIHEHRLKDLPAWQMQV
jgi:nicotinic acid mononucleotide adenylyltransferase